MVNSVVLVGRVSGDPSYTYPPCAEPIPGSLYLAPAGVSMSLVVGDAKYTIVVSDPKVAIAMANSDVRHGRLLGIQGRLDGIRDGQIVIWTHNIRLLRDDRAVSA